MEMEEIIKILVFALVLAVCVGGIIFLFKGKGGDILDQMGRAMRFG